ncbi:hypothetical protein M1373_01850 [Candidatus Marsarchaeota archaeon]|nr:hypothetical protein [Candidatus Marsarchaeota archaeon]
MPIMANASYTVTNLNTTVVLNQNTSAQVTEVLTLKVSNSSVKQYDTNRIALNLTLSTWQSLIGPLLVQHIINPHSGIYNFKFLPGPLVPTYYGGEAKLLMTYSVENVTSVVEPAPREFVYTFNDNVFNFEHAASGEVLPSNTTLSIIIPNGAQLTSVYPVPDAPVGNFTSGYANITRFSWFDGEPLSKFTFVFVTHESLGAEVEGFFSKVYSYLGVFTYIITALVVIGLILYAYIRARK